MNYGIHPSKALQSLFKEKPYQGQEPVKSKVIILGNDANYSPEISDHAFFKHILKYHDNGVSFWKDNGVHHPFLLPNYPFIKNSGGVPYHRKFSKMGFSSQYADAFSFLELLDVPTIGNTGTNKSAFFDLMNLSHLDSLESHILEGSKKFILVNKTLLSVIKTINKKHKALTSLYKALSHKSSSCILLDNKHALIYGGKSFSASISNQEISALKDSISSFLQTNNSQPLIK